MRLHFKGNASVSQNDIIESISLCNVQEANVKIERFEAIVILFYLV